MQDKTSSTRQSASEIFARRKALSVPQRSDSLTDSLNSNEGAVPETQPDSNELELNLKTLEDELASLPEITNFQIRFETKLKEEVKNFAKEQGVTPETLLQGLWSVSQDDPQILHAAVEEAKTHKLRRAKAAKLKNSITRLTNLTN